MIIKGTVEQKLPLKSGKSAKGNAWFKQSWVVNTEPFGSIVIDMMRNNEDEIPNIIAGEYIEFDMKIQSRQFKENWFTSCSTNEITLLRDKAKEIDYTQPVSEEEQLYGPENNGDLPF